MAVFNPGILPFSPRFLPPHGTCLRQERQCTFVPTSRRCKQETGGIVLLVGLGSRCNRSTGLAFSLVFKKIAEKAGPTRSSSACCRLGCNFHALHRARHRTASLPRRMCGRPLQSFGRYLDASCEIWRQTPHFSLVGPPRHRPSPSAFCGTTHDCGPEKRPWQTSSFPVCC